MITRERLEEGKIVILVKIKENVVIERLVEAFFVNRYFAIHKPYNYKADFALTHRQSGKLVITCNDFDSLYNLARALTKLSSMKWDSKTPYPSTEYKHIIESFRKITVKSGEQ